MSSLNCKLYQKFVSVEKDLLLPSFNMLPEVLSLHEEANNPEGSTDEHEERRGDEELPVGGILLGRKEDNTRGEKEKADA